MSLRLRIIFVTSLIFAVGFFFTIRWIQSEIRPRYLESVEDSLVEISHLLAAELSLRAEPSGLDAKSLKETFAELQSQRLNAEIYGVSKREFNLSVYVTDENGIVIYDSRNGLDEGVDYSKWNDVYLTLRGKYGARSTRLNPNDPFSSVLFVAAPIVSKGKIIGVVSVSKPEESLNKFLKTAQQQILWIGIIGGLIVIGIASLMSLWLTIPVQKLTDYTLAVRDGRRVPFPRLGTNEIANLGQAFEDMRVTLEGKRTIEQFVQSLTHEIKSPLTAIRGAAELLREDMPKDARDRFLENIRNEGGRIQNIVDELLKVAALESRSTLSGVTSIDAGALIRDVIDSLLPVAHAKQVRLESGVFQRSAGEAARVPLSESPLVFEGERFLVVQALRNLVANAIDFSPTGGLVQVAAIEVGNDVELEVIDEGAGIPEYALPRIYEKFYSLERPGGRQKSSGLGLSFVKSVVDLHGGSCDIRNRSDQTGVQAHLRFHKSVGRDPGY